MTNPADADKGVAAIPPFGLRMRAELKRRVEEAARVNNRSLNSEIVARLVQSFREEGRPASSQSPLPVSDQEKRLTQLEQAVLGLIFDERWDKIDRRVVVLEKRLGEQ
jgi:Arc-like DNA binding domain